MMYGSVKGSVLGNAIVRSVRKPVAELLRNPKSTVYADPTVAHFTLPIYCLYAKTLL
jgi:hypothetical protein